MSDDTLGSLIILLPLSGMLAGVVIVVAGMLFKARSLDMQHKERLALIERGLAPPPESTPTGTLPSGASSAAASRSRSIGVVVIGIGFAFMCLIGIAAQSPNEAIGIGGAIVILGTSFIVRSMLTSPPPQPPPPVRTTAMTQPEAADHPGPEPR